MYDFRDVHGTSKAEQIRAWAIEQVLVFTEPGESVNILIVRAKKVEDFIKNGAE